MVPAALGREPGQAGRPAAAQAVHRGPTPVGAVGATDQHSQVQLFMEGPYDKVDHLRGGGRSRVRTCTIPAARRPAGRLAYLPGHTLGELLRAEYEATSAALAQMGRMSCTLRLPDLSAASLGEAIMFFQIATGLRRRLVRHRSVRPARRRAREEADIRRDGAAGILADRKGRPIGQGRGLTPGRARRNTRLWRRAARPVPTASRCRLPARF